MDIIAIYHEVFTEAIEERLAQLAEEIVEKNIASASKIQSRKAS